MLSMNHFRWGFINFFRARPSSTLSVLIIDRVRIDIFRGTAISISRPSHTPSENRLYSQVSNCARRDNTLPGCGKRLCCNKSNLSNLISLRRYHLSPTLSRGRGSRGRRTDEDNSFDGTVEREFNKNLENLNYEDKSPKEVLEKIASDQYRRQKAMRFNRIRRQFPHPKEPRLLTNEMVEQIRFLAHEHPDDWDVRRLAEGFSVTEDTIRKVLHSKFVPKTKTIRKQDNVALKNRSLLLGDAQRIFVERNDFLAEGLTVSKEPKQDSIEGGKRPSAKYIAEGDKEPRKRYNKTYRKDL